MCSPFPQLPCPILLNHLQTANLTKWYRYQIRQVRRTETSIGTENQSHQYVDTWTTVALHHESSSQRLGFSLPIHEPPLRAVAPPRPSQSLLLLRFVIIVFINVHLPCSGLIGLSPIISGGLAHLGEMLLLLVKSWYGWWMVRCLRRVIAVVGAALVFATSLRGTSPMPFPGRRWPLCWRASTVMEIIEPTSAVPVGRFLVGNFVIVLRFDHPFEGSKWSIIPVPSRSSLSGSKGCSWWRSSTSYTSTL